MYKVQILCLKILDLILGVYKVQDKVQEFKKIVFCAVGDAHISSRPYQKG